MSWFKSAVIEQSAHRLFLSEDKHTAVLPRRLLPTHARGPMSFNAFANFIGAGSIMRRRGVAHAVGPLMIR